MRNSDYASYQLNLILDKISTSAISVNRDPSEITLVGASKAQSSLLIRNFHQFGLTNVGENYVKEAIDKQITLTDISIDWHYIGRIQSNKSKLIAENFHWVHGLSNIKHAQQLSKFRQAFISKSNTNESLQVLIQLNLDHEDSKNGLGEKQALELIPEFVDIDCLNFRGFMMIPKKNSNEQSTRATFAQAKSLLEIANQKYGLSLDTLSMGMSNDLEIAIEEGATMVRVGSALFGERQ